MATSPDVSQSQSHALLTRCLDGKVPGAAVAVVRAGQPLLADCYGLADLEWRQPVTPRTVFRLASLSKPFTALTVMLLERDGLLDLDAPIGRYLPGYPAHADRVLVRHLLTHTSGIPNFVTQPGFAGRASRIDHTHEELLARFAPAPLEFEPGSRYAYSNSGYRLLDMIVARAAGASFADVLTERVLAPAGMANTRVLSDEAIVPQRARGYQRTDDGFVNAPYLSLTIPGGAGGIGSSLDDLLRFDRALSDGGLADEPLRQRLFTPVRLNGGRVEGYGLGWALGSYRGRRVVHHAGGIEGFSCLYVRLPEEETSVIMLTNLGGYPCTVIVRRLLDAVLDLPAPRHRPTILPAAAMATRAGTYSDGIQVIRVAAGSDGLDVSQSDRTHHMLPLDATSYVEESDPDIVLRFHDDGTDRACTLHYPLWWITGYRL